MCMADGGDGPDFFSAHNPVARKVHKCGECGRDIQPGERYERHFGTYDGFSYSGKTCAHCEVLCEWLAENCDGYLYGVVVEDFTERASEYSRMDIARIAVMARNHWRSVRRKTMLPVPQKPRPIQLGDSR